MASENAARFRALRTDTNEPTAAFVRHQRVSILDKVATHGLGVKTERTAFRAARPA